LKQEGVQPSSGTHRKGGKAQQVLKERTPFRSNTGKNFIIPGKRELRVKEASYLRILLLGDRQQIGRNKKQKQLERGAFTLDRGEKTCQPGRSRPRRKSFKQTDKEKTSPSLKPTVTLRWFTQGQENKPKRRIIMQRGGVIAKNS